MRDGEHERLARMESEYWWHVGRRDLLARLLEQHLPPANAEREVLDVGCGAGGNLALLGAFGRVRGVEPAGPGLDACRARGLGPAQVLEGSATALPLPDASVDLVAALDVLEHLEDDLAGARELARVLRPGGTALVSVPAYRFLWSVHDEALGHRRRYMASEVHQLINRAGLRVVRRTYAVSLPLPGIMGFRIAQGLFPPLYRKGASYVELPGPLNRALAGVLRLESRLLRRVDLPVGSSILAVARKDR